MYVPKVLLIDSEKEGDERMLAIAKYKQAIVNIVNALTLGKPDKCKYIYRGQITESVITRVKAVRCKANLGLLLFARNPQKKRNENPKKSKTNSLADTPLGTIAAIRPKAIAISPTARAISVGFM
ncbi:hypothetical protein [Rhodoferax sp.]|uniref:hypothetical protein n=1 Tax=Rhodoferax sp. TaxID=50421 RepID=UPI002625FFC9|nr:hypothetical protein [Rhodoferax sp.]MDD2808404.1 hypothetical protein [Rhodoferax sp.]MDD4942910.1 hypothetical protein [Rhodoferax sp.]